MIRKRESFIQKETASTGIQYFHGSLLKMRNKGTLAQLRRLSWKRSVTTTSCHAQPEATQITSLLVVLTAGRKTLSSVRLTQKVLLEFFLYRMK